MVYTLILTILMLMITAHKHRQHLFSRPGTEPHLSLIVILWVETVAPILGVKR